MPTLDIDGVGKVKVDDAEWKELDNSGKQELVNRISREGTTSEPKATTDDSYLTNLARTGLGQGLLLGFGDEAEAGIRSLFTDETYDDALKDARGEIKGFRKENPKAALAAELGGGLLTGGLGGARAASSVLGRKILEKAGTTGLGASIGATEGAIAGFGTGEGGVGNRLFSSGVGATLGGGLGAALPAAVTVGKDLLGKATLPFRGTQAIENAAGRKVVQAIEKSGKSIEDVQKGLDDGIVANQMIADVGTGTQRLGRGSAAISGDAQNIAEKALNERQLALGDEIADDVSKVFGVNQSSADVLDDIVNRQSKNAAGDYNKAFNVDEVVEDLSGVSPYDLSSGNISSADISRSIKKSPRLVDTSEFKEFINLPEFDKAYKQAQKLAGFKGTKLPNLSQVKTSLRGDRLRFVDAVDGQLEFTNQAGKTLRAKTPEEAANLIKKHGMQSRFQGGETDNLSTLSAFNNATEGGFSSNTGANDMLNKALEIVGDQKPPTKISVEQLHYIKMGLDEVIDIGKRQGSMGRQLQREVINKKQDFINKIDSFTEGNYKKANAKFAGEMRLKEAVEEGKQFIKSDADQIKRTVAKLSPSEKQGYLVGVADQIKNQVDSAKDMANVADRIFGTPKKRAQLKSLFPSENAFNQFEKRMKARINQVKTRTTVNVGSRTAPLGEDIADVKGGLGMFLTGIPSVRDISGTIAGLAKGTPDAVSSRISRDLFQTNATKQRETLARLAKLRDQMIRSNNRAGNITGAFTGGLGALLGGSAGRNINDG